MRSIPLCRVRLDLGLREIPRERLDLSLLRRQLEVHGRQTIRMKPIFMLLAAALLTACGAHETRSAEDVARSWSAALDRNDNDAAARLFADGAKIVQNGELVLANHADAVRWNRTLPCGGKILSVSQRRGVEVLVVFRLEERPQHRCDSPGAQAAALFRVRDGKIVLLAPDGRAAPGRERDDRLSNVRYLGSGSSL